MKISAKSNIKAVAKDWKRLSKAYKKAVTSAINKTAYRIVKEENQAVMSGIDRPVRFTESKTAMRYRKASVNNPVADVYVSPIQEKYLQTAVYGGRGKKGKAVPVEIRLNKFGNVPSLKAGRKIQALLAKPNYFYKRFGDTEGIFKRVGKRLQMVIYFSRGHQYKKTFDWHKGVRKAADKRMPGAFNEAINKVIKAEAARTAGKLR